MSEFRFAESGWAYGLLGVAAFTLLLLWLEHRGGSAINRFLSSLLQDRLVTRPSLARRRARVIALGLCLAFLVLALMRPQWGLRHVATSRVGAELMICLDVSRSMLAEDVAPNRLERSKAEIADLLAYLDGDQVGIIPFAGRATVASPLTPDFGFLRLVLDNLGVHSVTRGGTRIGDCLRKATRGFGPTGEASRAILLITDGEDHESFPLDAAQEAAEVGIRIIAIGFGDESGSEVFVTDPRSGARSRLRDADGRTVTSRLDGDLLRELALVTEGAYIPAGTGVLDLESIYEHHIAGLTHGRLDGRGRTLREEGYQWAVLLALLFLVSGVAVTAGSLGPSTARRWVEPSILSLLILSLLLPGPSRAEEPETAEPPTAAEEEEPPVAPRGRYNRGVSYLEGDDPDEAERWFRRALREAKGDGTLRGSSLYNLGWTVVEKAETLEATEPDRTLALLYEAADWFREAVAHLPDDEDARHNLEVVLKRALVLADQLAGQNEKDLERELTELAGSQRTLVAQTATELGELDDSRDTHTRSARRRSDGLATQQRTVLSDADELASRIGAERDALEGRSEEEIGPEEGMRAVQLANVLYYLHRARERMGQTRRQLRQRHVDRAYRRSAGALTELKRALDQVHDPVRVLDALLRESTALAASTELLAATRGDLQGLDEAVEAPAWLTLASLEEEQATVADRTGELALRLQAGLAREPPPDLDPSSLRVFESARGAEPFVEKAQTVLARAAGEIQGDDLVTARQSQIEGIRALLEARERFLDLRGLVEAIYRDERSLQLIVTSEDQEVAALREYSAGLRSAQDRNLERSERLRDLIETEKAQVAGTPAPEGNPEAQALEQQRLGVAGQLLEEAKQAMQTVRGLLEEEAVERGADWSAIGVSSGAAVRNLEGLRRLFFSLVEHVREVAEEQTDLVDQTQDELARAVGSSGDTAPLLSLAPGQKALGRRSLEIANALEEQSRQEGSVAEAEADPAETSRRLRKAAEHILAAEFEMNGAAAAMEDPAREPETIGEKQQGALAELGAALELLTPPGQRSQPRTGEGERDSNAEGSEGEDGEASAADPAQLLQAVRDREAQRRREQADRRNTGYETVEKDW